MELEAVPSARAQADESFDDDGFEDDALDPGRFREVAAEAGNVEWSLTGFLRSADALWVERLAHDPIAKLRQSLDLDFRLKVSRFRMVLQGHAEYDFATRINRARFDDATLQSYEYKLNTREAHASLALGAIEIKFGRLIEPWGSADFLSSIDMLNPRDLREPGDVELEDLRLPVLATRVAWSGARHTLEVIAKHENSFGYRPAPRSEFSPLRAVLAADPLASAALEGKALSFRDLEPAFAWDLQGLLFRWRWSGPSVDLSLVGGTVLDRSGTLGFAGNADVFSEKFVFELSHARHAFVGHAGTWAFGDTILLWEVSADLDRALNVGEAPMLDVAVGHLYHALLGVRYTGITDWVLSVECARPFLGTPTEDLLFDVEALSVAALINYRGLSERLEVSIAWLMSGGRAQYGWFVRGDIGWRFEEGVRLGVGFTSYQPGTSLGFFSGLDSHDRAMMSLRWDFQIK